MSRRVCISATFTAEPIQAPLELLCSRAGLAAEIEFAPYNQVFQQLLDPSSGSARNTGGVNFGLGPTAAGPRVRLLALFDTYPLPPHSGWKPLVRAAHER